MTARDFCFWLQGHLEIGDGEAISEHKVAIIRKHLALVFKHEIDPSMGPPEHQQKLNDIHGDTKPTAGGKDKDGNIMRC